MARVTPVRGVALLLAFLALASALCVPMLLARLVTLGRARRLCAEVFAVWLCRAMAALAGLRVELPPLGRLPAGQLVYTLNHSSTVDAFVVLLLRLPNTRYFMKREFWKIPPLAMVAWLIGTFFTPPQTIRANRVRCFQRVDRVLRRTGDSVCLSPEGTRVTTGEIGSFNKGAFHLAASLGVPIQPIFIEIPREIDPGRGLGALPGTIRVHLLPLVKTDGWRPEDAASNKERVRAMYVDFKARLGAVPRAA